MSKAREKAREFVEWVWMEGTLKEEQVAIDKLTVLLEESDLDARRFSALDENTERWKSTDDLFRPYVLDPGGPAERYFGTLLALADHLISTT